jgi:hypothetical protein
MAQVQEKKETAPYYRYYLPGVLVKLFAGLGVRRIYVCYYSGGDTLNYFYDCT